MKLGNKYTPTQPTALLLSSRQLDLASAVSVQRAPTWGLILSSSTCFPVGISPSLVNPHSQVLMRSQAIRLELWDFHFHWNTSWLCTRPLKPLYHSVLWTHFGVIPVFSLLVCELVLQPWQVWWLISLVSLRTCLWRIVYLGWDGKTHPPWEAPFPWESWNVEEEVSERRHCDLCFLTVSAVRPAASNSCHFGFSTIADSDLKLWPESTLKPLLSRYFITAKGK